VSTPQGVLTCFLLIWRIRKVALDKVSVVLCNRRGFSAEKRILVRLPNKWAHRFEIAEDGRVKLFTSSYVHGVSNWITANDIDGFQEGKAIINGTTYTVDDEAVAFLIYGGLVENGNEAISADYNPIRAYVCKISELPNMTASAYDYFLPEKGRVTSKNCSYAYKRDGDNNVPFLVAMPAGNTSLSVN